jgi:hypothetical protein
MSSTTGIAPRRNRVWLAAIACFIVSFVPYCYLEFPCYPNSGDNFWYVPTALSILQHGDIDLARYSDAVGQIPPWEAWMPVMDQDPRVLKAGKARYGLFPLGTALASLPIVAAGSLLHDQNNVIRKCLVISRYTAAIWASLSVALLFVLLFTLTRKVSLSAMLTLVFAFDTPHLSTHHNALWSHNVYLPFLLIALLLMVWRGGSFIHYAALPLAMGYIIRPDSVSVIVLVAAYVALTRRRSFIPFVALGGAIALLFMAWSWHQYGLIVPPYYSAGRLRLDHFNEAALANLGSPNRGLFVFVPLFFFSVYGAGLSFQHKGPHHGLYRLAAVAVFVHWLLISMFPHWWGGFSYGPRLFCAVLPLFVILLVPVIEDLGGRSRVHRALLGTGMVICLCWSAFVQVRGVTDQRVHDWNSVPNVDLHPVQVWSWPDMQILRGMIRSHE